MPAEKLGLLRAEGGTVVVLASASALLAAFVLTDEIRSGAAELIADLGDWAPEVHVRASNALSQMGLDAADIATLHALAQKLGARAEAQTQARLALPALLEQRQTP